jgi:VCBS repeat-containing protein
VLGAGDAEIVLADSTPSTDDGTDLGDGTVGAPGIVQTFTIRSASDRDLTVSGIEITGTEAAEFSVGGIALPATIPAGGTTTFTVTFEPVGGGTRSAGVGIQSSVAARSPFTFSIQGTGTRIPVATADGWAMLQGTTLAIPAPGVLANDTDADGDQLTAVKVSDPAHGSLTLNADGSFSYTPTPAYIGSDSFTYKAEDGSHESNVATVSILVQQAHPVTFVLGTHGTRTGGGELEQVVVHGGAAEAPLFDIEPGWAFVRWSTSFASVKLTLTVTALYAPAYSLTVENGTGSGYYMTGYLVEDIAADAIPPGMKFAGWSVDPLMYGLNLGSRIAESTTFSMPSSAVTLTANYAYLDPVWEHELSVAGTTTWSLSFGMHLAATDGVDDDLDITHEDHGDEDGFLSSDDGQDLYSTEFRGQSESADYLLVLKAQDGVPVTASWAAPTLPEGKKLTIYEVVLSGGGVDRSAYTRTLVGYTAMDMSQAGSVTVPAGETRAYVLRYGDDVVYDLPFAAGWNLVSLPIEPTDPTTGTVLAGDDSRGGVIHTGSVWQWEDSGYVAATEMHACVGYWVYVEDATALLVQGQTVNQGPLVLSAGLNLCGTAVASDLPEDAGIGVVWLWQAACMRYCTVTTLLPGRGYWITAPAPVVLTLPGQ